MYKCDKCGDSTENVEIIKAKGESVIQDLTFMVDQKVESINAELFL